jgi:tryptophan-rich sensory protein
MLDPSLGMSHTIKLIVAVLVPLAVGGLSGFAVQLALNGLWSIVFFGMQSPGWAFAEIILLWLAVLASTWLFWGLAPAAGWLMLPYLAWVGFAAVLNGSIWILNR